MYTVYILCNITDSGFIYLFKDKVKQYMYCYQNSVPISMKFSLKIF